MDDNESFIDSQYENLFARLAGYLPEDRAAIDEWQATFLLELADRRDPPSQAVMELEQLIHRDPIIRMYVTEMIDKVPTEHKRIHDVAGLLTALDGITRIAPKYNRDRKKRIFFPMSALFVYMMMTTAGEALFRNEKFNRGIQKVLKEWCTYLDGAASCSVLNEQAEGWLSPEAAEEFKLTDYVIDRSKPHWGFSSFNGFFHRQIDLKKRPVDQDPKAVVSANDGTVYKIVRGAKETDRFWLKNQPYSLFDMLNGSEHTKRFIGGDVFQSFLSGADYHRWRSPVDGVIHSAQVVDGLMFSNAESAGHDDSAGTKSQAYQASVNTRGLVFIKATDPKIGMVCVIPIGITEISSIALRVSAGQSVKKGDELGHFSYGGSSMCLVFQPDAVTFDDGLKVNDPIRVNARIARAAG